MKKGITTCKNQIWCSIKILINAKLSENGIKTQNTLLALHRPSNLNESRIINESNI